MVFISTPPAGALRIGIVRLLSPGALHIGIARLFFPATLLLRNIIETSEVKMNWNHVWYNIGLFLSVFVVMLALNLVLDNGRILATSAEWMLGWAAGYGVGYGAIWYWMNRKS